MSAASLLNAREIRLLRRKRVSHPCAALSQIAPGVLCHLLLIHDQRNAAGNNPPSAMRQQDPRDMTDRQRSKQAATSAIFSAKGVFSSLMPFQSWCVCRSQ